MEMAIAEFAKVRELRGDVGDGAPHGRVNEGVNADRGPNEVEALKVLVALKSCDGEEGVYRMVWSRGFIQDAPAEDVNKQFRGVDAELEILEREFFNSSRAA